MLKLLIILKLQSTPVNTLNIIIDNKNDAGFINFL